MFYKRRYIQFNDLVIDHADMLDYTEYSVDFKVNTHELGFGHGSYLPRKRNYPFAKEVSVSLTFRLEMLKLPCEYREFYKQYAIGEILKPGKLWAVVNNELVWAYASINSYSEAEDMNRDQFIIELDLILHEGVWHKADKLKTFIRPYDRCEFMDCKDFQKEPCPTLIEEDEDCCTACINRKNDERANSKEDCSCCCCDLLSPEMALCYNEELLQGIYDGCSLDWKIEYDCRKGKEFFGHTGKKMCTSDTCNNLIVGRFYSDTEMPTTGVEIVLDGAVHNPRISINDNVNYIEGDYDGLRIKPNGDVYAIKDAGCCEELLNPSVWQISTPRSEYGWTVKQGMNRVVIDRGTCCGRACAYIQVDSLTI